MTDKELLVSLTDRGMAMALGPGGSPNFFPAHIEIVETDERGTMLFFVERYPSAPGGVHAVAFDDTKHIGDIGLAFYRDGEQVAYVAPFEEWPEIDPAEARAAKAVWDRLMKDDERRANFNWFVESERPLYTGADAGLADEED